MQVKATIFGGTGDLTNRKLMPAFYNLYVRGDLSEGSEILAVGRRAYTDEQYREIIRGWILKFARLGKDGAALDGFLKLVRYFRMDFTDAAEYARLQEYEQDKIHPGMPHLIYLAVAPQYFPVIVENVKNQPWAKGAGIVLEKPFGDTLENACALNREMEAAFGAENIYRIDHYLGKEMVRNILAIRCTNPLFGKAWNKDAIESIQISALEDVGVETRGGYYDHAGALKDMVQNHLLQILSIVAMEDPCDPSAMHANQLEVLNSLHQIHPSKIRNIAVLGQYEGYTAEDKVDPQSMTETYAALRLGVDTPRWKGMPFLIRTGKKCGVRKIEMVITFKRSEPDVEPDVLIIDIQPTEGVTLHFNIKKPGDSTDLERVSLDYCQSCNDIFRLNTPEAYERMLWAAFSKDQSWFSQWDQIETSWRFVQSVQDAYRSAGLPVYHYEPGTQGPAEAAQLTADLSTGWRQIR
jgi:glucose-6-phosphate 1-dehydrogenase